MTDRCPLLEYRALSTAPGSDPRAYCTAVGEFVQPLRADICTNRYELAHDEDCEFFRDHVEGRAKGTRGGADDAL